MDGSIVEGVIEAPEEKSAVAIEATGNREGGTQGYGIRAIVTLDGTAGYRYVYYKSPARVEP
jgi:hypothetical protein